MIQFSLNGQLVQEEKIDPNWTILRYLRISMVHNSVKEGCAGGDCGACSILVAQQDDSGSWGFEAINACIALLGSLDGKTIFTVEGLASAKHLHPVQQAMVDFHGSQCGFCSPGIVASLAALYHNKQAQGSTQPASEHEIHEALSGNLCRCTGYRPIIDAAKAMSEYSAPHELAPISEPKTLDEVGIFDPSAPKQSKKPAIDYEGRRLFLPQSEAELAQLLSTYPTATLWAGGTDLGLEVTQQFKQFKTIICLQKISSLTQVSENDEQISFGTMVSYSASETYLSEHFPSFSQLLSRIAARQIRNLGTLGGNVANASPIGDTPPVFLALNARVELASQKGRREVPLDDFFLGYKKTAMQTGEYLSRIIVPKLSDKQSLHVFKVSKRKEDDISAVLSAAMLEHDGQTITQARIAFGGMAATPLRAAKTEKALIGQPFKLESFEQAASEIKNDYSPMQDVRATPEYRLTVASNLIIKTGLEIFQPESLVQSHSEQGGH